MRLNASCVLGSMAALMALAPHAADAVEYRRMPVYQQVPRSQQAEPPMQRSGQVVGEAPRSYTDYVRGEGKWNSRSNFSITGDYRVDQLDWNIAAEPTGTITPNILSELTWSDLQIAAVELDYNHTRPITRATAAYAEVRGSVGKILNGDTQDSDYFGDNRTDEFSRSYSTSTGSTFDVAAALGYALRWKQPDEQFLLSVMPLGGYGMHKLNLNMREGRQAIPYVGAIIGLNSTYEAQWKGPFFGADITARYNRHRLGIRGEYHIARYSAEADWNLREEFYHPISFVHKADGTGTVLKLEYGYLYSGGMEITLGGKFQQLEMDAGLDRTFFNPGMIPDDPTAYSFAETRLNGVNWESQSVRLGVNYKF